MTITLDEERLSRLLASRLPEPSDRRRIRVRARLSLRQLASVLRVDHSTLARWETGQTAPRTLEGREAYGRLLRRLADHASGSTLLIEAPGVSDEQAT